MIPLVVSFVSHDANGSENSRGTVRCILIGHRKVRRNSAESRQKSTCHSIQTVRRHIRLPLLRRKW